ncbi:formylglycine-generating enzyme family protein [Sinimarinibacterium sp. CAU 1509]|uniref:formylglycine-generating enzyme family protein n=1 Tax=Sinimarinibacterium sp. CAU 1509 TaxID=2562283 RepID=UPI0010AC8144|nr:formylglycine-generating enzyme family protein [Sinimarinibacterium sp. CAU 1509]TJY58847.1 formylglycine-generating enzyme family protein [Sinimarinibacterium sp. CAU 1509]
MRVRSIVLAAGLLALSAGSSAATDGYAAIDGGTFRSVLPAGPGIEQVDVAPFRLAKTPVTNAQFLAFVQKHPQWRRDRVAGLFADQSYLQSWANPVVPGAGAPADAPVVQVSWFAASAYCESVEARLPTWYEWEYAAAADETRTDARSDPAFRARMLSWYARTADTPAAVGKGPVNAYGVFDLHALVWEWVSDFNALMVSTDSRDQGEDPDLLKFCGAGAITMQDKENYAVLMRIAMLSSLQGAYTTANLGFRCARDGDEP